MKLFKTNVTCGICEMVPELDECLGTSGMPNISFVKIATTKPAKQITITIWKKLKLAKRSENLLTNFHTFGIFSTGKFFFVKSKLDTGKHCRILVFSRLFINLEFTHYFAIFFPVSGCMKELFLLISLLYLYV